MRAVERREEDMARKREESREASLLAKQRIAAARTAWAEERAAKIEDLRAQWAEFKAKRTASEAAAGAAERTAPVLSGVEDDVGEQGSTRQTAVEAAHAKWEADRIGRVQALQRHWAEYRRRREESAKGAAYPLQGGTPGHSPRGAVSVSVKEETEEWRLRHVQATEEEEAARKTALKARVAYELRRRRENQERRAAAEAERGDREALLGAAKVASMRLIEAAKKAVHDEWEGHRLARVAVRAAVEACAAIDPAAGLLSPLAAREADAAALEAQRAAAELEGARARVSSAREAAAGRPTLLATQRHARKLEEQAARQAFAMTARALQETRRQWSAHLAERRAAERDAEVNQLRAERTREKEELRIAAEQLERELGRHRQKLKRTVHQADMGAEGHHFKSGLAADALS
jgi:hypothetical protein